MPTECVPERRRRTRQKRRHWCRVQPSPRPTHLGDCLGNVGPPEASTLRGVACPCHERRELAQRRWVEDLKNHDITIRDDYELCTGFQSQPRPDLFRNDNLSLRGQGSGGSINRGILQYVLPVRSSRTRPSSSPTRRCTANASFCCERSHHRKRSERPQPAAAERNHRVVVKTAHACGEMTRPRRSATPSWAAQCRRRARSSRSP